MPEIPTPIPHTADAIDEACAARGRASDWGGIPISSVADPCDRALWYSFRWVHEPEKPNGKRERIFETGRIYEDRLMRDLAAVPGVAVATLDPATGKQFAVQLCDGHLRGKMDGKALGLPEAPKTEHIVECKSLKDADAKAIVKKGLREAKPEHFAQLQMYLHAEGYSRGLYLATNKNTDELVIERVERDAAFGLAVEARMGRIIEASAPPAKINDAATVYPCTFCKAKEQCHSGAWARLNCRTCIHSTPVSGGKWRCEKHGCDLKWDEQQAGCTDHRFIPALVPGEQIDVIEDDMIVYRMPDGSEWIDGRRE